MAVLILADIHANLAALDAVLDSAGPIETIWCLGDTVGYGPQPNECVAIMRKRAEWLLVGNHDLACLGTVDLADFNQYARAANLWNGQQLTDEHRSVLMELQPYQRVDDGVTLAHASPRDPIWEYLLDVESATDSLDHFDTPLCFVGHTHQPMIFVAENDVVTERIIPSDYMVLDLEADKRYIINPGGVGQPRDGDARAAWALYDREERTITFRRTLYNIKRTQTLMLDHRLPEILAARLSFGL